MSRRITFRELCAQLGISEDGLNVDNDDRNTKEADDVSETLIDAEEDADTDDDNGGDAVDDEGDIDVFAEMEDEDSDEEERENASESDQEDGDDIASPSGVSYTTQQIPARRRRRNIMTESPRVIAQPQTEKESFELLISEEILRTTLMHTNRKVKEVRRNLQQVSYSVNTFSMDELKAGLAIILKAGRDRDNFTDLEDLWKPADSRPFYRAVMGVNRFKFLLRCLRFDNWHTRPIRRVDDKFAAVSEVWNIFLRNIRTVYIPGDCITVDEQLLGYRGRVPGRTYIPSKPRKYGLKIFWACESNSGYALNAMAYGGKEGNSVHHNLAQDVVMKLLQPWYGTGRDVCTDNYFTSYSLAQQLLLQNLTLLGTVRRHRREIPLVMRSKADLYSSRFIFNHDDGICLVAYQAKKNKGPVMLLSSSHGDTAVESDETKKPLMILEYNARKGGVDMFDQNVEEFSCRRKTVRWPLLFFCNMLDAAANNAFLMMRKNGYRDSKKQFLSKLCIDLAKPAVHVRLSNPAQKHSVKDAAAQMGLCVSQASFGTLGTPAKSNLPKRCTVCKKSTRAICDGCKKAICPLHRIVVKTCRCERCAST